MEMRGRCQCSDMSSGMVMMFHLLTPGSVRVEMSGRCQCRDMSSGMVMMFHLLPPGSVRGGDEGKVSVQ